MDRHLMIGSKRYDMRDGSPGEVVSIFSTSVCIKMADGTRRRIDKKWVSRRKKKRQANPKKAENQTTVENSRELASGAGMTLKELCRAAARSGLTLEEQAEKFRKAGVIASEKDRWYSSHAHICSTTAGKCSRGDPKR